MATIEEAVKLYRDRQSGAAQPSGHYDHAERWYPAETEWRDCCIYIRFPSRRWPQSYLRHCRTVVHVAALCGVDAAELRRAVAAPRRRGGATAESSLLEAPKVEAG